LTTGAAFGDSAFGRTGPEGFAANDAGASALRTIDVIPTGAAGATALGVVLVMGTRDSDLLVSDLGVTVTGMALLGGKPMAAATADVGTLAIIAAADTAGLIDAAAATAGTEADVPL
jgi:hypothetical protein